MSDILQINFLSLVKIFFLCMGMSYCMTYAIADPSSLLSLVRIFLVLALILLVVIIFKIIVCIIFSEDQRDTFEILFILLSPFLSQNFCNRNTSICRYIEAALNVSQDFRWSVAYLTVTILSFVLACILFHKDFVIKNHYSKQGRAINLMLFVFVIVIGTNLGISIRGV
jgi:hypothetical protein